MDRDHAGSERAALRLIMSRWWVIVGAALLGMVTATVISQQQDPVFESSAKYVVAVDQDVEDPSDVASALSVLRNRQITTTFAEILQSQTLLDRSARQAEVDVDLYTSSAAVLPESNVVTLTISGATAEDAHQVNTLVGEYGQAELSATYPIFYAILLESPKTPTTAVAPAPTRDALFGGAVGAFLGLILATVWPSRQTSMAKPVEIESARPKRSVKSGGKS